MEINKEIEKNINKNLLQCKDMIINELVSIFGKEYAEQIKASFDNIIIMYTTKKETIDELFNNRDSLDDETISLKTGLSIDEIKKLHQYKSSFVYSNK